MKRLHLAAALGTTALVLWGQAAHAEDSSLPGSGFAASHYQEMWTKSPFAVASATEAPASPDYGLIGVSRFDNVTYASLIDKKTQERIQLSTDTPVKGFTLVSMTRGHGSESTSVIVQKDGQSLTLRMEAGPAVPMTPGAIVPPMPNIPRPPGMATAPGMPTTNATRAGMPDDVPFTNVMPARPPPIIHRPPIRVPPPPPK